jgi:ABC-type uncharacterized transport system substrate-binding protein
LFYRKATLALRAANAVCAGLDLLFERLSVAAKAATAIIPIVFTTAGNPVELGLVASFGRPGGNITGAHQITGEVSGKRLELVAVGNQIRI